MKKFTVLVMGLVSLGAMAGCEDDDRKSVRVPAAVQGAFGKCSPLRAMSNGKTGADM